MALLLGTSILFLCFREFITQGYVFPVRIAGDSMVPSFMGDHTNIVCRHCGISLRVERPKSTEIVQCPNCSAELNVYAGAAPVLADLVLIDKLTYRQRNPVRGDVVALWDPFVSGRLIIKRIVGLPNEKIEFVEGQVYVDGSPVGFTVGESLTTVNDDRYRRSNFSRWEELDDAK